MQATFCTFTENCTPSQVFARSPLTSFVNLHSLANLKIKNLLYSESLKPLLDFCTKTTTIFEKTQDSFIKTPSNIKIKHKRWT